MSNNVKVNCLWCNKNLSGDNLTHIKYENPIFEKDALFVCSNEHKKKVLSFLENARNYYSVSLFGLNMGIIIYPLLSFLFRRYFSVIVMIMSFDFGIGLFFFPFTTPNLIKNIGIKKAVIFAKIISIISLLFGFSLLGKILK